MTGGFYSTFHQGGEVLKTSGQHITNKKFIKYFKCVL